MLINKVHFFFFKKRCYIFFLKAVQIGMISWASKIIIASQKAQSDIWGQFLVFINTCYLMMAQILSRNSLKQAILRLKKKKDFYNIAVCRLSLESAAYLWRRIAAASTQVPGSD